MIENDNQYLVTLSQIMIIENSLNEALNTTSDQHPILLAARLAGMFSVLNELLRDAIRYKIHSHDKI